jgi:hypothetical protein
MTAGMPVSSIPRGPPIASEIIVERRTRVAS